MGVSVSRQPPRGTIVGVDATATDFADRVIAYCEQCRQPVVRHVGSTYCPRCGLAIGSGRQPVEPMLVQTPTHAFTVLEPLAGGESARVYHCDVRTKKGGATAPAVFKIAATGVANEGLKNESVTLWLLTFAEGSGAHQPFFPRVVESFAYVDEARVTRRANVLAYDPSIRSPAELYSLAEVRAAYPDGLDARDVAWMLRRVLSLLAFAHGAGVGHGAVTPAHVLIEPREHKLVVVGWANAGGVDANVGPHSTDRVAASWLAEPTPRREADVALAGRTFIGLLGGDPVDVELPDSVDAGVARFLERCVLGRDISGSKQPGRLLSDFDRLIDSLWGKRTFRPFAMPPRA